MALSIVPSAYWKADAAGILVDSTPNGRDLTDTDTVGTTTGALNEGWSLNGTSEYLSRSYEAWMVASACVSVSFWIKPTTNNDFRTAVCRWDENSNHRSWAVTIFGDNKLYVYRSTNGTDSPSVTSVSSISTGSWTHVVVTQDPSDTTNGTKIYLNGSLDKQGACGTIYGDTTVPLEWGHSARFASAAQFFYGVIDEAAILVNASVWNSTDVSLLYNSGTPPSYGSLVSAPGFDLPFAFPLGLAGGTTFSSVTSLQHIYRHVAGIGA